MCDKKNSVLFTETECLVLSPDFKLLDENPLGKFDGKADDGFLVGYSINSKAFKVFTTRTRKVEESIHIIFLEHKPNVARSSPDWLFDIDLLINSMNYEPVTAENQTNRNADRQQSSEDAVVDNAGQKTNEKPANEDTANLLNTGILSGAYNDEDEGTEADLNNLETTM
ncbi:hypothetical protein Tco_1117595, partial [Tanacetum coccineum]